MLMPPVKGEFEVERADMAGKSILKRNEAVPLEREILAMTTAFTPT